MGDASDEERACAICGFHGPGAEGSGTHMCLGPFGVGPILVPAVPRITPPLNLATDEERLAVARSVKGIGLLPLPIGAVTFQSWEPRSRALLDALVAARRRIAELEQERDETREWLRQTGIHAGLDETLTGEDAFNAITSQGEALSARADAAERKLADVLAAHRAVGDAAEAGSDAEYDAARDRLGDLLDDLAEEEEPADE